MSYVEGLGKTEYVPNVVILFAGQYFCIREPDSGLVTDSRYNKLISRVTVNPTGIDPLRPTTTFNTSSFTLLDEGQEVTKLFLNQPGYRVRAPVRAWLGRSFEGMDFADYLELPETIMNKCQKVESSYNFSTIERKDRLEKGIFNIKTKLAIDILDSTTTITLQAIPTGLPSIGYVKIEDEFIEYDGIGGNNLLNCARGAFNSIPAEHGSGEDVFNVWEVTARNGIDFLAQVLISGSGNGSSYDVLPEGLGFDESLVDVEEFEEFRDEFFSGFDLSFLIWGVESVQKFLEEEIYLPMGVRLRTNNNGKIGLAVLNRNIFTIDAPTINESNTFKSPGFSISDDKIINQVRIFWDWQDGPAVFAESLELEDADSIAAYGATGFTELSFKGVKDLLFAQSIANLFIARFANPRPEITVDALNSTTYLLVGEKTELISHRLPTEDGDLEFISTLEVLKKAYDVNTGTVKYTLAFTSFSGIRQCFISPSDLVVSHSSQKVTTFAAGRGAHYRAGWKMRHYDNNARDYADAQVNTIQSVVGDVITWTDNWTTTVTNYVSRFVFADYDDVTEQQKKFCFISEGTDTFADGSKPYQVTFN